MNFLRERRIMALAVVLILGFLPILGAIPDFPDTEDLLPESRDLHLPESSISKATIGTLSGDADAFMSTVDWGSIENFDSTFVLGGFDEWGLALGFAKKFGKVYLGASYSGDLIDEVYRRITNKEVESLWKVDRKDDATTDPLFEFDLEDEGGSVSGSVVSNNDINIIVGVGVFGGRLGFSEYIRSVKNYSNAPYWAFTDSLETSLKPNLELGFNIPAGKVTIKPSLRGALDIRQFRSKTGRLYHGDGTYIAPKVDWVIQENGINFIEPSGGLTIAVEFALSDTSSMEFALEGDGYFRMYPGANDPGALYASIAWADAKDGYPRLPLFPSEDASGDTYLLGDGNPYPSTAIQDATLPGLITVPMDFWAAGAPSFAFSGDITERVTLGVRVAIDAGFGLRTIETDNSGVVDSISTLYISAAPDLALGASLHLIPDHFSLHAGFGVGLFSFERIVTTTELAGVTNPGAKVTESRLGLPTARFGGGLTVNLTQALALDAMVFASGLDFDATKFNLLLTLKK